MVGASIGWVLAVSPTPVSSQGPSTDQRADLGETVLVHPEPGPLAALFPVKNTGLHEQLEVVTNGRLRPIDCCREVTSASLAGSGDDIH